MYKNIINLRILYLEDDKTLSKNYLYYFKQLKSNVTHADNYEQAKELFNAKNFDLIISDINLPTENGIAFIKFVRETNSSIPIIVTSGYTDKEYLLSSIDFNVTKYFIKPYKDTELFLFIDNLFADLYKNKRLDFDKDSYYCYSKKSYIKKGIEIALSNQEATFLEYLHQNDNDIVSYADIQIALSKDGITPTSIETVRTVLKNLRQKTEKTMIKSHSGFGYSLGKS